MRTNNTKIVRITEGGNAGISTTTPSNKLTVAGNQNITGHLGVGASGIVNDAPLLWNTVTTKSILTQLHEHYQMVRLKAFYRRRRVRSNMNFNSKMVRLKDKCKNLFKNLKSNFNSKMVRLKANAIPYTNAMRP